MENVRLVLDSKKRRLLRFITTGSLLLVLLVSLAGPGFVAIPVEASNWAGATEQAKLTAGDGVSGDIFGNSVSVSGDTAVIGAEGYSSGKGAAYVFTRSGATWTEQAELTASDGVSNDYFGHSVSLDGETAVIGSYGNSSGKGATYVFTRSGSTWTQQAKLTAGDGASGDNFGNSVSVSGDTAVIGAQFKITNLAPRGAAYVFTRSSGVWTQQAKLVTSDGLSQSRFGCSVSLSGDTALIGSCGNDLNTGETYVFTRSGAAWTQQAKLTASGGLSGDHFGYSVSQSGDTAAIGAESKLSNTGVAYIFTRSSGAWTLQAELTASDGASNDRFGHSVSLSGDTAVIGAYGNSSKGAAYVFSGSSDQFTVKATVTLNNISVTIPTGYPTAVDYGVLQLNDQAMPQSYTPSGYTFLRVQNNGSAAEDFYIQGNDATCGSGRWALGNSPGLDQYCHFFSIGTVPAGYFFMGTGSSFLASNVAANGNTDFNLKIGMPSGSTVYGQYSTTVKIVATAH